MAKFIYNLLVSLLILGTVNSIFAVLVLPTDIFYLLICVIGFGLAVALHENLLEFLTIQKAWPTRLIAIALLVALFFYVLIVFIPGFDINGLDFEAYDLGFINTEATTLGKYATIAILSITSGLIGSTLYTLNKSKSL